MTQTDSFKCMDSCLFKAAGPGILAAAVGDPEPQPDAGFAQQLARAGLPNTEHCAYLLQR
jgi:hypothetical protein